MLDTGEGTQQPHENQPSGQEDEFLRDELRQLNDAFLRNEDQGERRVSVFLGLVAALVAGAGLAVDATEKVTDLLWVVLLIAVSLIPLGWMTLTRLVQRNLATSEYLRKMAGVRRHFLARQPRIAEYLPYPPREDGGPWRRRRRRFGIERGGLVEIVAFTNSLVAGAAVGLGVAIGGAALWLALTASIVGGAAAWVAQLEMVCRRYSEAHPIGSGCPDPPWRRKRDRPSQVFRANVGIIVLNHQGDVLALERADVPGAWQLPQGGLWVGEDPQRAALRELQEETGLPPEAVEFVAEYPEWLSYELPRDKRSAKTGRGQVQRWLLFKLKEESTQPSLPTNRDAEFRSWRWAPLPAIADSAISFRKPIYERLAAWRPDDYRR
jgi:putative (di)nucleoside polyphosphate hydrolase